MQTSLLRGSVFLGRMKLTTVALNELPVMTSVAPRTISAARSNTTEYAPASARMPSTISARPASD